MAWRRHSIAGKAFGSFSGTRIVSATFAFAANAPKLLRWKCGQCSDPDPLEHGASGNWLARACERPSAR